ncbi:aminoimidazole riboside kinase [Alkalihalobacillus trypoxylicola]|uniref:Fructokinase n=1 Tax=Alkalihalobacillus trypoxylicola TaxID=519424 RepID=A0A162D0T3_9BACI|nr:aminoimidazole riboside kinase [Alkalihalobacillus trypoxylicola]KYG27631.1 fructokinase [Alkalihalobacillus trypoxylicola]
MKQGVISLGEALVDFIPLDLNNLQYQKSAGGAPANVAVGVSRLGVRSAFIGKVGNDQLGSFLKRTLTDYGVQTHSMTSTGKAKTGLVLVTNDEEGERSFEFFVEPSADQLLSIEDYDETIFERYKILHIGSITMIRQPSKQATEAAVRKAKDQGLIISYDPNLRLNLWRDEEQAKESIMSLLPLVDFLKVSEEELFFLTGKSEINEGIQQLQNYQIPFIVVTLGANGCYVCQGPNIKHIPARKVLAVDTTGAGDAFVSGMLYSLEKSKDKIEELSIEEMVKMAELASISGALAASKKGAMTALPTIEEIHPYLLN